MMEKRSTRSWRWGAGLAVALVALTAALAPQAQGQGATVRLVPPTEPPISGGPPFTMSATVDDVTNLGAFELILTYDPAVLRYSDMQQGPFLGSTGRRVQCLPPQAAEGSVGLTCVTLGATPDGPNGSGELATITFEPLAQGSTTVHFARLTLTDPPANSMPAQAQDATVKVSGSGGSGGFRWALWGPIIGGVILALGAASGSAVWWVRRSRSA
jgi:hypothetical protein